MRAAARTRLQAQPRPILPNNALGTKDGQNINANGTVQISAAIPVTKGDVIVVKATSGTYNIYASGISTGGTATVAWNASPAIDIKPASGACPMQFYVGVVTVAGTIQPTVSYTGIGSSSSTTTSLAIIAERFQNARLDPINLGAGLVQTSTPSPNNGPWSSTYVPYSSSSVFTFMVADFNASNGGPATYLGGAAETRNYYNSGILGMWAGWQYSLSQGVATTFGVSAPAGERSVVQGIEIKPIAA